MEPVTQFSNVPYSLMDIQLPESPGNVKSRPSSDSIEHDSVSITEENHSNGLDSTDIKNKSIEKTDSNEDHFDKVCSPASDSNLEKSGKFAKQAKEYNSDDSKTLESRSQLKNKESTYKSSKSKEHSGEGKTRKSKEDFARRDSRSKSRETKRTRKSSEDSSHRRSRSRERTHRKDPYKEDSRNRRDSRSRSKEKNRRTRKYEKDSDNHKALHGRRDSRSRSKECDKKTYKSSLESKSRKGTHRRRKSRSSSNDSKSDHSSNSDKELKKRGKYLNTKQKRRDSKKENDSENDKSLSSSSDSSPSRNSKRVGHSSRQKEKRHRRDSSEVTQSSRSRSPAKTKPLRKAEESSETSKHKRHKNKDDNHNSRESSPVHKKSKSKLTEKSDKHKEVTNKEDISDVNKVPNCPSYGESSIKKKSKNSNEPQTLLDEDEKIEGHKHRSLENEDNKSRSREISPVHVSPKKELLEQDTDSANVIETSKRSGSSEHSRSQSREKSPLDNNLKQKSELHDKKKSQLLQEKSKNRKSKSRSKSRELSPIIDTKPIEQPDDSAIPAKTSSQENESENGHSDDNQTSRSKSGESTPVHTEKGNTDESSIDSVALTMHAGQESQISVDSVSKSISREKSPDPKRTKLSIDKPDDDSWDCSKDYSGPTEEIAESNLPGTIKKGNITIVKKEPMKQKLKIKRDNVIITSKSKTGEKENIEKLKVAESTEENQKESTSTPVRVHYVSRKITLSSRSQSATSEDEPKSKRSKWGSLVSSQKTSTINISTHSLKNLFPNFKLLKDPAPEEFASLVREEKEFDLSANKPDEDCKQISKAQKFQEPQEVKMEVDQEEAGPVSKVLFIQNLVRPFTLNQLKELLRETGNFIEDEFWIDKIKSKCFVTYKTEEEAIKTRNHLNGTRWPSSNPKILSVEFSNEDELTLHRSGNDVPKIVPQPAPELNETQESRTSHSFDEFRKKDHEHDRRRERSKQQPPVREWDKDKITQESPDREHSGKDAEKSKYLEKKDKKDSKRRTNEDTPAKLLDDLFQKTKSSPCIYWLPLTDEQVQEKMEAKRLRQLEREKRTQQRDQEDSENKSKRPRSRNRARDVETRRSSTRSRSPATRRR